MPRGPLHRAGDEAEAATRAFEPETHAIIGAAIEVHRRLRHGFLEAVYHEALLCEFGLAQIPCQHEVAMPIYYRGRLMRTTYRADFLCYGRFIVELKAQTSVGRPEEAQVVNDLRASGLQVGLLLNFAAANLEIRRLTNSLAAPFPGSPGFPVPLAASGTSAKSETSSPTR